MAVKHLVIHECDLCGKHVSAAQLTPAAVGFAKYDTCPDCTEALRRTIEEQRAQYITNEEETS